MSLKNLKLSPYIIASLYTTPLVLQNTETVPLTQATALKFLGSNKKNISILVNISESPFLTDQSFNFLTGILKACHLNIADVAIFNIHQSKNNNYITLNGITKPKTVLLFGVSPQEIGLPLQFPHFQVQPYNNVTYICAPSLDSIEADINSKAKLWMSLKTIFQL